MSLTGISWMNRDLKFILLLVVLAYVSITIEASPTEDGFLQCKRTVEKWASSSLDIEVKENKHVLRDLLFFLHVPRTGGRTYFYCFLKRLYPDPLDCPRSYDRLRFNPRQQNCRLFVSHNDYSIMPKLPVERTSVVTVLRNPIDRVFSSYEFSIEVAARFLVHPNLTSAIQMSGRIRKKRKGVSTLDVWPWKYLVPWMREDLFARREARKGKGLTNIVGNNSYSMADIVMPLHEYINDPVARDVIHNGATFQVAGLTNNSDVAESHEVRHCVMKYPNLGDYVLEVAKKRLDNMLYIGLTEKHKESAAMFANVVGAQAISQLMEANSTKELVPNAKSEQGTSFSDSESDADHYQNSSTYQNERKPSSTENSAKTNENLTVEKLMKSYETCMPTLRNSQSERRAASLKKISPANFTKEARSHVLEEVIQEIASLNRLDVELYKYANDIFTRQHTNMLPNLVTAEGLERRSNNLFGDSSWKVLYLAMFIILLILFIFVFANARRRTSKLKV